jgi:hypothetical protein
MKPAHMIAILDRMQEIAVESGSAIRGVELKLGGSFYPDDGDGARNLLSVGEQKLDGPSQCWEESLRALLRASGSAAEEPTEEMTEDSFLPAK